MSMSTCPKCSRSYAYDLPLCTWCAVELTKSEPVTGKIIAVTKVEAPSIGHEDVPYWVALVCGDDDTLQLRENDTPSEVGATVPLAASATQELAAFGVIGTGTMGRGLTELLLKRGHCVVWVGRSAERLERARRCLLDRLSRVMEESQVTEADTRLTLSDDYAALADSDVVIEAVIEVLEPKAQVLAAAEAHMRPDAVLATNTSGLPLDELGSVLAHPGRFGVLHFFNPPSRMRLVETAIGAATNEATSAALDNIAIGLGKIPVRVSATPAFAVNRVLMPMLNEAIRELEEGVAPAQSIDDAIRLGLNHPMGPLALADLIGLDVVFEIMGNLAVRTGDETYRPRPMLGDLVAEGKLGRKTGEGFYCYEDRVRG